MACKRLNTKYIGAGFLYFYIHFVTELVCFYMLTAYTEAPPMMWLIAFAYDMLAFAPQSLIGRLSDKYRSMPVGLIGLGLLAAALVLRRLDLPVFIPLTVLCLGNCCTHVSGAEATLRVSHGSLTHSAVFVSGGSFGVVFGQLLAKAGGPAWLLLVMIATAIPFEILAQMMVTDAVKDDAVPCRAFRCHNAKISRYLVIVLAVTVVAVRGFMAYGIPTSWRKTTMQTIMLFSFMGIGKALGGVMSDMFGIKKTAILSLVIALPFLLFGDKNMYISLFGVMLFSMTMSVTLAVLVSVMPRTPGLAFGFTTIGLFLGALPVFFVKITGFVQNCVILTVLTAVCVVCMYYSIRKDELYVSAGQRG